MDNVTKDGITVSPGQVWRDLDKRMNHRHCKVLSVKDGKATMIACNHRGVYLPRHFQTKVSVRRMHKSSTGWALVE